MQVAVKVFILSFSFLLFIASKTYAIESSSSEKIILSEDNFIIAEVFVGKDATGDVIEIYQYDGGYLLPLGLLSDILEFSIDVNIYDQVARGWFVRENRIFNLDLISGKVIIEGSRKKLDKRHVTINQSDIYVDSSLYSDWFPVDFELNFSDLILYAKPREKLPVQERLEREVLRNKSLIRISQQTNYSVIREPYRLYDVPIMDIDIGHDYSNTNNTSNQIAYSMIAQGDLAYLTTQVALVGESQNSLTSLRINAGRSDYSGNLLGKMKAKTFMIGDITATPLNLITNRSRGRGVTVSNMNLERSDQFDSTNFVGDSQPGWEVEIYRNGVFLDYQIVDDNGRYEFLDVPIFFGNNIFRIVSYGPQGQQRERIITQLIDNSILKKGEFNYEFSADEKSRSVFGVDEGIQVATHKPGERIVLNTEYGLMENMTTTFGFARTPLNDGKFHDYQTIGVKNSFSEIFTAGMLTGMNLVYDSTDKSWAAQFVANARVMDVNVRARQELYNDFISEVETNTVQQKKSLSNLDLDGRFSYYIPEGIAYRFGTKYEKYEQNRKVTTFTNRLSTSLHGIGLSNNVKFVSTKVGKDISTITDGSVSARSRYKNISLRVANDYDIEPILKVRNLNLTIQKQVDNRTNARLSVRKDLLGEGVTSFNGSLNKRFNMFTLSAIASANDDGDYSLGTKLSFSVGREPRRDTWFSDSRDMANYGAASVRAFLDNNYNDVFDDGDDTLSEVGFISRTGKIVGNEDDPAVIPRLEPYVPSAIEIDYSTLEDPFWMPKSQGYMIVPRPGVITQINFPVYVTTEIDGTIQIGHDTKKRGAARMVVELVDKGGKVIDTTKSEFDGFYIFEGVLVGEYTVRVAEESLDKVQATNNPEEFITVSDGSDIISGVDLLLHRDFN